MLRKAIRLLMFFSVVTLMACGGSPQQSGATGQKAIVIGLIAKSQSNPVFQAARVGAEDAAVALSKKYGVPITIDWRTPNDEDAQQQANSIETLVNLGAKGIIISCSDASMVTNAIDAAVKDGVPVACFDSDAPASKRFYFFGIDQAECGRETAKKLCEVMGDSGVVAILGGNQNAPNLQARVKGARDEFARHPNMRVVDAFYHKETPQDGTAKVEEVQNAHPDINGWCMIGGWPLFTDTLLKWEPGKVRIVAVDALPAQLPYVEKGVAQALLAQDVYSWGYRTTEVVVDKVLNGKDPAKAIETASLIPVSSANVAEFAKNWKTWLRQP